MTPKEDKVFGAFSECPVEPLEGIPIHKYMTNLNVYLNLCSSAVDCTLEYSTLGYLVLTPLPAIFHTYCGTAFVTLINPGIHPILSNRAPTATIFSKFIRTHKNKVRLFNKYYAVDSECKKVIRKLTKENFYKSLSSRIIGFAKVTSLEILSHLITEYAELEEEGVHDINRKMKDPISGKILFEEFVEQIEWNQEAVAVKNSYSPA